MTEPIIQYFSEYLEMIRKSYTYLGVLGANLYRVEAHPEHCPGCGKQTEIRRVTYRENGKHLCTFVFCPYCAAKALTKN